jgi:hypothetical protein
METSKEATYYQDSFKPHVGRVSWPAIFAGALMMLITLMLLSLLGLGIGLGTINPMDEAKPLQGLGTGALIWWVISNLIAVFVGAYIAANLTNIRYKFSGIYHGVLAWSLFTILSFWIMTTTVGGIISGVGGAVSKSMSSLGKGVKDMAQSPGQGDMSRINQMIQGALTKNSAASDTATREFNIDMMAVIQDVFFVNGEIRQDVSRPEIERSIARNSTLSQQDVRQATDQVMIEYERIKQDWPRIKAEAQEKTQEAAGAASKAAIWSFVSLLLGVITAAIAGRVGNPDVYETEDPKTRRI